MVRCFAVGSGLTGSLEANERPRAFVLSCATGDNAYRPSGFWPGLYRVVVHWHFHLRKRLTFTCRRSKRMSHERAALRLKTALPRHSSAKRKHRWVKEVIAYTNLPPLQWSMQIGGNFEAAIEFEDLHIYVSVAPVLIQAFRVDDPIVDASLVRACSHAVVASIGSGRGVPFELTIPWQILDTMCRTRSSSTDVTFILTPSCRICHWSSAGSCSSHAWATPSREKNNLRMFLFRRLHRFNCVEIRSLWRCLVQEKFHSWRSVRFKFGQLWCKTDMHSPATVHCPTESAHAICTFQEMVWIFDGVCLGVPITLITIFVKIQAVCLCALRDPRRASRRILDTMCLTQSWSTEVTLILTSSCRRCNWSSAGSRTSHAWATPSRGKNNLRRFLYPKIAQIQFGRKFVVCDVFLFRRSFTPDGQYNSSLDSCCVHWNCIVGINTDNHFTIGLSGRARTCPSRCVFGLSLTSRRFMCSPRDVRYDTGALQGRLVPDNPKI